MDFGFLFSMIAAFFAGMIYKDFAFYKRAIELIKQLNRGKDIATKDAIEYICQAKFELASANATINDHTVNVKNIVKLKHEIINDVHYFFVADTDVFVAQGQTLDEAAINYAAEFGKDTIGFFKHCSHHKTLCFLDNTCVDYVDESSI